jgi:hypothetical protein
MNRIVLDSAPAPISRAYRLMYDQPDPELAYPAIALFSEPLIKWYGVVALVLLRQCRPDVLRSEGLLSQFLSPSLGVWTQLIRLATTECGAAAPTALRSVFDEVLSRQSPALTQCVREIEDYLGSGLQKRTMIDYFDALVFYRNKTRGHGAPSPQHQRDLSHVLLEGYDDVLRRLDGLQRLRLVYVERAEIHRGGAVHVLRICNGLNSFILPERLALGTREGLASGSVHLFSEESKPLVELSPILVRPPGSDGFYFYNGSRKNVEYLSYDGTGQEYYRPDGYLEAVREFLSLADGDAPASHGTPQQPRFRDRDNDREEFSFGDLGM